MYNKLRMWIRKEKKNGGGGYMLREKYCNIFANLLNAIEKYKYWCTINVYEISVV